MRRMSRAFAFGIVLAVCGLSTASLAPARALPASLASDAQPTCITQDLVYFYTTHGVVDVTSTIYQAQGHTYAVVDDTPIAFVVNMANHNVYTESGDLIGYTTPTSASPH